MTKAKMPVNMHPTCAAGQAVQLGQWADRRIIGRTDTLHQFGGFTE